MVKYKEMFNIPFRDFITTSGCNLNCSYCFVEKLDQQLDKEKIKQMFEQKGCLDFSIFGGEPLLVTDLVIELLKKSTTGKDKSYNIITNGILLPKHIDKFEGLNVEFQISIDGPEHVTNMHRKYHNGKGAFEDIVKGIDACIEKGYTWSMHGVCTKETIPYFAESLIWMFDKCLSDKRVYTTDKAIETLGQNTIQIIMEDNFTDDDIDELLTQVDIFNENILKRDDLNNQQKLKLINTVWKNKAGVCSGGTTLLTVDPNCNIYTCHRYSQMEDKGQFYIGSLFDVDVGNVKILNSYDNVRKSGKGYSTVLDINRAFDDKENIYWMYWCPATFYETTGSVYKIPSKYNILMYELNRKIKEVLQRYGYAGEQCNCNGHKCDNNENKC